MWQLTKYGYIICKITKATEKSKKVLISCLPKCSCLHHGHVNTDLPDQSQSLVSSAWPFRCNPLLPSAPPYHSAPLGGGRRSLHHHTHLRCDEGLLHVEQQNGGDVLVPHSYHFQQYCPGGGKAKLKVRISFQPLSHAHIHSQHPTYFFKHHSNTNFKSLILQSGLSL